LPKHVKYVFWAAGQEAVKDQYLWVWYMKFASSFDGLTYTEIMVETQVSPCWIRGRESGTGFSGYFSFSPSSVIPLVLHTEF